MGLHLGAEDPGLRPHSSSQRGPGEWGEKMEGGGCFGVQ